MNTTVRNVLAIVMLLCVPYMSAMQSKVSTDDKEIRLFNIDKLSEQGKVKLKYYIWNVLIDMKDIPNYEYNKNISKVNNTIFNFCENLVDAVVAGNGNEHKVTDFFKFKFDETKVVVENYALSQATKNDFRKMFNLKFFGWDLSIGVNKEKYDTAWDVQDLQLGFELPKHDHFEFPKVTGLPQ